MLFILIFALIAAAALLLAANANHEAKALEDENADLRRELATRYGPSAMRHTRPPCRRCELNKAQLS